MTSHLTKNAMRVLEARYLLHGRHGRAETPDELFERVAREVARGERAFAGHSNEQNWHKTFLDVLTALDFLPNSPTLMNAGTSLGQLSACFVIPVEDTMEGIFEAVKQMALVQRSGGGTGFSFSDLRPAGDLVTSTEGRASGPVSFMHIFDTATENIRQGGKRRGANMGVLRVDHPDVMSFIEAKLDGVSLRNFNISVAVTDGFMVAVRDGREYPLVNPRTGQSTGTMPARTVFEAIANAAWQTGDPGLLFLDAINRMNPTPNLGSIETTNPCGEVPLLPWESCNLGSINLAHMTHRTGSGCEIDWPKLERTVAIAVRFLDNVVEVNRYPGPDFDRMARANRKIGLGVMGFAEMLIELGISYDSDDAVEVAERVMSRIRHAADRASLALAEERGVYPAWRGSVHEFKGERYRNATRTAIAPTGTIGILAGTTASIEPLFALAYRRHALDGEILVEVNELFRQHLQRAGLDPNRVAALADARGGITAVTDVPEELRRLFVTALEIPWRRHLQIQAAFQRHVDNSVSKTINLPNDATLADVRAAYWAAWELGLKGITVYRYGSKGEQVLELGSGEEPFQFEYSAQCDPNECRL